MGSVERLKGWQAAGGGPPVPVSPPSHPLSPHVPACSAAPWGSRTGEWSRCLMTAVLRTTACPLCANRLSISVTQLVPSWRTFSSLLIALHGQSDPEMSECPQQGLALLAVGGCLWPLVRGCGHIAPALWVHQEDQDR